MYKFLNRWSRKLHRWGALACALPLLLVIITGLILQVKKQWIWVQPPTQKGTFSEEIDLKAILEVASKDPQAEIETWKDVDRLDVRPSKGVVKVRAKSGYEVQIDLENREIVQTMYRRSDWLEALHDGSFFGDWAKLSVFLMNGAVLLFLWISGVYLWYLPFWAKSKKRKRQNQKQIDTTESEDDLSDAK